MIGMLLHLLRLLPLLCGGWRRWPRPQALLAHMLCGTTRGATGARTRPAILSCSGRGIAAGKSRAERRGAAARRGGAPRRLRFLRARSSKNNSWQFWPGMFL